MYRRWRKKKGNEKGRKEYGSIEDKKNEKAKTRKENPFFYWIGLGSNSTNVQPKRCICTLFTRTKTRSATLRHALLVSYSYLPTTSNTTGLPFTHHSGNIFQLVSIDRHADTSPWLWMDGMVLFRATDTSSVRCFYPWLAALCLFPLRFFSSFFFLRETPMDWNVPSMVHCQARFVSAHRSKGRKINKVHCGQSVMHECVFWVWYAVCLLAYFGMFVYSALNFAMLSMYSVHRAVRLPESVSRLCELDQHTHIIHIHIHVQCIHA